MFKKVVLSTVICSLLMTCFSVVGSVAASNVIDIKPAQFRALYNAAAKDFKAPLMPAKPEEEQADSSGKSELYMLTNLTALQFVYPKDGEKPESIVFMGQTDGKDISSLHVLGGLASVIIALTPELTAEERNPGVNALGIAKGEFTDGKVRSWRSGDVEFITKHTSKTGTWLIINPVQ